VLQAPTTTIFIIIDCRHNGAAKCDSLEARVHWESCVSQSTGYVTIKVFHVYSISHQLHYRAAMVGTHSGGGRHPTTMGTTHSKKLSLTGSSLPSCLHFNKDEQSLSTSSTRNSRCSYKCAAFTFGALFVLASITIVILLCTFQINYIRITSLQSHVPHLRNIYLTIIRRV
jgi:hypothetical protein